VQGGERGVRREKNIEAERGEKQMKSERVRVEGETRGNERE
jgi:hypothetical protein